MGENMPAPQRPTGIKLAQRPDFKVNMVITGPSGAGKSVSAAILGKYFAKDKPYVVISTEKTAAFMYQPHYGYEIVVPESFHPEYLTELIKLCEVEYGAIVFDSVSPEWAGIDGALATVTEVTQALGGKDSVRAWGKVTPMHDQFVKAVIDCKTHMLAVMQVKNKLRQQTKDDGKKEWISVVGEPIQRAGFIDLFTTNISIDQSGVAGVWKHRMIPGSNNKGLPVQGQKAWDQNEESVIKFAERYDRWLQNPGQ